MEGRWKEEGGKREGREEGGKMKGRKGGGRRDKLNQRGPKRSWEDVLESNEGVISTDPPSKFPL